MSAASTAPLAIETPLERAVREAVEAAPPMSSERRDQVARLLSKGAVA